MWTYTSPLYVGPTASPSLFLALFKTCVYVCLSQEWPTPWTEICSTGHTDVSQTPTDTRCISHASDNIRCVYGNTHTGPYKGINQFSRVEFCIEDVLSCVKLWVKTIQRCVSEWAVKLTTSECVQLSMFTSEMNNRLSNHLQFINFNRDAIANSWVSMLATNLFKLWVSDNIMFHLACFYSTWTKAAVWRLNSRYVAKYIPSVTGASRITLSVGCSQTLQHTPAGQERIPASRTTLLFIQPTVKMILSHNGAFPLCTCVFGVVLATAPQQDGAPHPERFCTQCYG